MCYNIERKKTMLDALKEAMNYTETENGAVTYKTTGSCLLDLFATVGALRHASNAEIERRFIRAYSEDRLSALKILFYARDIREGLGERRVFRVILSWLAKNEPEVVLKNLELIAEYGRYDDLVVLLGTPCEDALIQLIRSGLERDLEAMRQGQSVSLLAKWLPSVNASRSATVIAGKRIARALGMSEREYRKALVSLRRHLQIIENNLRERDYTFDYSAQPSQAMLKYRAAFYRNDKDRYTEFLSKVTRGEVKLNASTVAPYQLVDPYLDFDGRLSAITESEALTLNATWESLTDFSTSGNNLAVIDTSSSMYYASSPKPASVALSLGIYFAEHSKGAFAGHFIEFSDEPTLIHIKGDDFVSRLRYVSSFNRIANTNLEAVFDVILKAAVNGKVPEDQLPERLILISDMEFDECVGNGELTNFESARLKFERAGYKLPSVVFWNVCSRNEQQPVRMNDAGAVLVSGCTPRTFEMVAEGTLDPYAFMLEVLNSERYMPIAV